MNIEDAIAQGNVLQVESIIKQKLDKTPCDVELWIKLCLTELQFPLEDYVSALKCIAKIYTIACDNIDTLILETAIKWHNTGYIDTELFDRLCNADCKNNQKMAVIYYLQSLYHHSKNDTGHEKAALEKSIYLCGDFVYPYISLGYILLADSSAQKGSELIEKAVKNVQKVFQADEKLDFTNIDFYISEFVTGTTLSKSNFDYILRLAEN